MAKKREKTGKKWARNGLKKVGPITDSWQTHGTTGADCQSRKKILQHRYVTVEIGAGRCDVTKYGAVGDGKADDVRVQQQPAPGLALSSDYEVVATGRRVRFRKRSTRVQSKAAGW